MSSSSRNTLRKLADAELARIHAERAAALAAKEKEARAADEASAPPPVVLPPAAPDPMAAINSVTVLLAAESSEQWRPHPGAQTAFLESSAYEVLYGGAAGGGKALGLDEPIPTPSGWTTNGSLRVGDQILGRDGRPTTVVQVFRVIHAPESYRLTFDDGATIIACADHRWLTFNACELAALTRRCPVRRAERRRRRAGRASGNKSAAFTAALIARNKANPPPSRPAPAGTVRTTAEIVRSLRTPSGRANHAMPVGQALELPDAALPLDPYVLGAWLGDGSSWSGDMTSDETNGDQEFMRSEFDRAGLRTSDRGTRCTFGTRGLVTVLRSVGVYRNKHIPAPYLRASRAQRLAMLQGLMDTDGTVTDGGSAEFTNTNRRLAEGVHELVMSLGWKARLVEGRATLNGRDVGPKWDLKWTPSEKVFRLPRKRDRQRLATRRTTRFRYVVRAERVPSVPMRCLKVDAPDGLFLAGRSFLVTHNSDGLLFGGVRYISSGDFRAIYFRRVYPELAKSVIPRSRRKFPRLGGRYNQNDKSWTFPSGAIYSFSHLQYEDTVQDHLSAEYQYMAFDELTTFLESQYKAMLARGRSSAGIPVRVRAGTNPGGEGHDWVQRRWAPWLGVPPGEDWNGPTALPGEVLWYINTENEGERYISSAEAEAMLAAWLAATAEERANPVRCPLPLTRTFIPARVEDNPALMMKDPAYVQRLMGLDPVRRAQLLRGDWNERPAPGKFFNRAWFKYVDAPPARVRFRVRHWDLAGTEPEEKKDSDPDWTIGLKLSITDDGHLCIEDVVRGQWSPKGVEAQLVATAALDGRETHISLPQDPGQAGKFQADYLVTLLNGYIVHAEPETGDKVERAGPISAQAERQNVSIVKGPWNAPFIRVLERFPSGKKDDVDALSGAHRYLTGSKPASYSNITKTVTTWGRKR